ncbi:folate-binding protein [Cyanobium sp. FACHB-13342]|uniref:CAF17-like 4Fe-4S cluster assembly/insertion protein YgfZ n=1 Tax=Cyanobium sp. FACHB-13342 TaxID=2692793 RepID=UPI0016818494|nr:folate-binding protein [Cyanobium sp. FACHB-13342]MBD2422266.1 folate-binding protein [Cyanobium sp. FACHB-13342]
MTATPWDWQPGGPRRRQQDASLIRLEGPDTRRFLHGQTSAAIETQQPGSWIPTCCITATGRLRALAEVLVDDNGAWLLLTSGDAESIWQALDRVLFPADQVRLGPVMPAQLMAPVGDATENLPRSPEGRWLALEDGSGWLVGSRLVLQPDAALPLWLADRPPLSPQEQERWRIQQGTPTAPGEINEDTNPFEVGLADRVSLSKGCYVGQETLAKLATYDGVKRQLRRWHWHSPASTSPASALFSPGEGEDSSRRAGQITSALHLGDGLWIGLALVRRQALDQPELLAGNGPQAPYLQLSRPPGFVDPPVGAGRQP